MVLISKFTGSTQVISLHGARQAVTQIFEAKQAADKTLNLFVYDEIRPSGTDWYTGEEIKSEASAEWFREQLEGNEDAEQINLFVNSVGGYVTEAMGMRALLLRHKANKDGYVDGWAASAASFLLTGCDQISMLTGSMQFIHEMSTIAWGTADYFRQMADQIDHQMIGNRQMYLERAGDKLTEEKLIEMMKAETWLTAQECVDLGLADRVIQASEYKNLVKQVGVLPIAPPPTEPPNEPIVTDPEPPEQNKVLNLFAALKR